MLEFRASMNKSEAKINFLDMRSNILRFEIEE